MFFSRKAAAKPQPGSAGEAVALFTGGMNCAQALVHVYGRPLGIDDESAVKVAGAFGSGMGCGETCGAVTGALMVIGLRHAKVKGRTFLTRERTDAVAREFLRLFRERNGATSCRELLGCDVSTPEGCRKAKEDRSFKQRCPKFVQDAGEILDGLLEA
jgi:C_GCAxxG_C_C family probable redox protein